jgi:hydroxyquinol 1,2-dioxygenase
MRDFDETNITEAVVESFGATPDPRLRQVVTSLVHHLHDFIRDVDLKFDEWSTAIDFLTKTGHMCTDTRQEFILLSDVLGASMLVDAVNHSMPGGATQTTVLGPFFVDTAPEYPLGADISGRMTGEPLFVTGIVQSEDGRPLAGSAIDVWHADDDGFYDVQQMEKLGGLAGRARFYADERGEFNFWSIVPKFYPIPDDGPVGQLLNATGRHPNRPAHVHFLIAAEGYETLVTHVFAADSPWLDSDAVFGVKNTLIKDFAHMPAGVAMDGREMDRPYRHLDYRFGLKASAEGVSSVGPRATIRLPEDREPRTGHPGPHSR